MSGTHVTASSGSSCNSELQAQRKGEDVKQTDDYRPKEQTPNARSELSEMLTLKREVGASLFAGEDLKLRVHLLTMG